MINKQVEDVYIEGISRDFEFGAGIEMEIGDTQSWMADYRHGDYWYCPALGTDFSDISDETQGLIYEKKNDTYGG